MLSGKELRDFRNSLDLSLRDVERETYISKKTLIGIESEEKQGNEAAALFGALLQGQTAGDYACKMGFRQ